MQVSGDERERERENLLVLSSQLKNLFWRLALVTTRAVHDVVS